jgi:hypothetical protein
MYKFRPLCCHLQGGEIKMEYYKPSRTNALLYKLPKHVHVGGLLHLEYNIRQY